MNFVQFTGHRKTSDSLLNTVKDISKSPKDLLFNLQALNIFNRYSAEKNSVKLHEASNTIKMKLTSKGKGKVTKSLLVNLPNIFGGGEFLSLSFHGPREISAEIGKPVIMSSGVGQVKLSAGRSTREIDEREIDIKKAEISAKLPKPSDGLFSGLSLSLGAEKIQKLNVLYSQGIFRLLGIRIDAKAGATKTDRLIPFLKVIGDKKFGFSFGRLFYDTGVRLGKIFGQTSLVEKFFIGDGLRGYKKESIGPMNQNKKIGGNSFIEVKNRVGMYIGKFELFLFGDVGVSSVKGLEECAQMMGTFGDNNCIGKSVGVGISMKNKKGPSFIFAVPMTTNPGCEKYVLGVDFEF